MTWMHTILADRHQISRAADAAAFGVAVSLPWSTSATAILAVIWFLTIIPMFNRLDLWRTLKSPPGALPVLLVVLCVVGTSWADASLNERLGSLRPFLKLLAIPLLLAQFRQSESGLRIVVGYFISCTALLALSLIAVAWPASIWWRPGNSGVPFKDYIAQSAEFVVCAFCLLHVAFAAWRAERRALALATSLLVVVFLGDVLFVATSRMELIVVPLLAILLVKNKLGWKWLPAGVAVVVALGVFSWITSSYLRDRVEHVTWEIQQYEEVNRLTSTGLRIEFWRKSLGFIAAAPIFGHGTGSIKNQFREHAVGTSGASAELSDNPHNETFAVAIQLGLIGVAVLYAMWIAHALLFRTGGLAASFGLIFVVQNVVGSIFNSHLSDFTEGWTYVWGVGVLGGIVLRSRLASVQPQAGIEALGVWPFGPARQPEALTVPPGRIS